MPEPPSPARQAALDALVSFCASAASGIEAASRHVLKTKRDGKAGGAIPRAERLIHGAIARHGLDRRDTALATEIFQGTLRNLIGLDHLLGGFVKSPKGGLDLGVLCILRLAAYQLMHLDRTPEYAVVSDATEQAKARHGKGASGFVNGVLRSLLRGRGRTRPVEGDAAEVLSVRHSFPLWLVRRWMARYGETEADSLLAAMNAAPGLTLRVNLLKGARDGFIGTLEGEGVGCAPGAYATESVRLTGGADIRSLPGYAEGMFAVQDEAAMLVSRLLAPVSGGTYLDACAAPGGKATHIAELASGGASVVAADISLDKLRLINENINRLATPGVITVIADAADPPFGVVFDGVLVDAPCTGLGVIRRRPEIRYTRRETDISRMAGAQLGMLEALADTVRPGGALVFSTCSTEPEEGEGVVDAFLAGRPEFRAGDAAGFLPGRSGERPVDGGPVFDRGFMRTMPGPAGMDGFFAARLSREK